MEFVELWSESNFWTKTDSMMIVFENRVVQRLSTYFVVFTMLAWLRCVHGIGLALASPKSLYQHVYAWQAWLTPGLRLDSIHVYA